MSQSQPLPQPHADSSQKAVRNDKVFDVGSLKLSPRKLSP